MYFIYTCWRDRRLAAFLYFTPSDKHVTHDTLQDIKYLFPQHFGGFTWNFTSTKNFHKKIALTGPILWSMFESRSFCGISQASSVWMGEKVTFRKWGWIFLSVIFRLSLLAWEGEKICFFLGVLPQVTCLLKDRDGVIKFHTVFAAEKLSFELLVVASLHWVPKVSLGRAWRSKICSFMLVGFHIGRGIDATDMCIVTFEILWWWDSASSILMSMRYYIFASLITQQLCVYAYQE